MRMHVSPLPIELVGYLLCCECEGFSGGQKDEKLGPVAARQCATRQRLVSEKLGKNCKSYNAHINKYACLKNMVVIYLEHISVTVWVAGARFL